jgi:hypothetical protein
MAKKKTKAEETAELVAAAVGAGRKLHLPSVDFADPNRPKTCLEVDFPILPIQPDRPDRGQRRQAHLPDVQMVGTAALQRVPRHADRGRYQGPG